MSRTKLKLVTLGEISSGKTSIVQRLLHDKFAVSESTVGASFFTYDYNNIRYEIWDTAGSERFMALAPIYFRNADIVLLVFDLSAINLFNDYHTGFEKVEFYLKKLQEDMHMKRFKIIIIGTKSDLVTLETLENIKNAARIKINAIDNDVTNFVYISSKTGDGYDNLRKNLFECGEEMKLYKNPVESVILLDNEQPKYYFDCLC